MMMKGFTPYEFLNIWQQSGSEPSVSLAGITLSGSRNDHEELTNYFASLLSEAILRNPCMVEPVLSSHMASCLKNPSLNSELLSSQDRKNTWFSLLNQTIFDLPTHSMTSEEGLLVFVDYMKNHMEDLRVSSSRSTPLSLPSFLLSLSTLCKKGEVTPYLGYRMVEQLFPFCSHEEKENFILQHLIMGCHAHTIEFVVNQHEKGNVGLPNVLEAYHECLAISLLEWEGLSSSFQSRIIHALTDKDLRNEALHQYLLYAKHPATSQKPNSFSPLERFNCFCQCLPQDDLAPLIGYLLENGITYDQLPPFLKSHHEKDLILQEVTPSVKLASPKKM